MAERVETVVIGAGQAGLSMSSHLTERGREHVVLEQGDVAETWRTCRWDGFFLNTPNWSLQLPGGHYDGPEPDAFGSLAEVIEYLDGYAETIDAPVRTRTKVTAVRRGAGGRLSVEAEGEAFDAANVVVSTGAFQRPHVQASASDLPGDVLQLTPNTYRRPAQLPDGAVLIVGSGQSGCQIADELLRAGRTVYLSVGACPWLPRRYRGREVMHWLRDVGLLDQTVDTLPSLDARLTCNPPISGNDGGHDCHPRWLAAGGVILVGRLERIDGARIRFGSNCDESLAKGEEFVANFRARASTNTSSRQGSTCPTSRSRRSRCPRPRAASSIFASTGSRPFSGRRDTGRTSPGSTCRRSTPPGGRSRSVV